LRLGSRSEFSPAVRQLAPFAVTALSAWIAVLFGEHIDWTEYAISLALLGASWWYGVWVGVRGQMRVGTVVGSLGFLAAVGLLRQASGGSTSGISILALLPVFQTALYVRDRRALWIVLAAVLAFYLAPLVLVGPPEYPASGYRSALLSVAVSSIVGLVTHELVANIRRRASEARRREHMLVRISETVQILFQSPEPRRDACHAVKEISDALVVGLFEPEPGSAKLRVTTTTKPPDAAATGTPAQPHSAVYEAFRTHQPLLITDDLELHVGDVELWRAGGAPSSILYQPLLKDDVPVGVMFVGWPDIAQRDQPRVVAASLLAHEIAIVLDRADVIDQLTDDALTDPLTGLPNRRAWDAQLELALLGSIPVAVAMFDIDHFKRFNDTHGHPAGDRLLREAAASWRAEMRVRDFLARLGGEEFALLLTGDDVTTVHATVERLRARMPGRETCSAGIAVRVAGDTAEQLVSRADQALYEAKTSGRDRTVLTNGNGPGGWA
jgi:diguanylate cyclase (GGDEF)-like protein